MSHSHHAAGLNRANNWGGGAFGGRFVPDPDIIASYQNLEGQLNDLGLSKGLMHELLGQFRDSKSAYLGGDLREAVKDLEALKKMIEKYVGDPILVYQLKTAISCIEAQVEETYVTLVRIGVTYENGANSASETLVNLAKEDINSYYRKISSPYRFEYYFLDNAGQDSIALANTETFHEMGIDLIVGHSWSSMCEYCLVLLRLFRYMILMMLAGNLAA